MSVPVRPFVDTNVLLYLLSDDAVKAERAEALLSSRIVISLRQVRRRVCLGEVVLVRHGISFREGGVMGWARGFEPPISRSTIWRLNR